MHLGPGFRRGREVSPLISAQAGSLDAEKNTRVGISYARFLHRLHRRRRPCARRSRRAQSFPGVGAGRILDLRRALVTVIAGLDPAIYHLV
jgi:hypothetical protein